MNWKDQLGNIRPEIIKAVLTILSGWLLHRLTGKSADLITYMSHTQTVNLPPQGQAPGLVVNTFTLFLWNQGKAPAKDVDVLHHFLPAHNVYPDVQRTVIATPGGGTLIHFPSIPPKLLISVSYVVFNVPVNLPIISHVTYEHGPAHHIPVNLQRVFPKPVLLLFGLLGLAGIYTVMGWLVDLILLLIHH